MRGPTCTSTARALAERGDFASAISRSYYAMFYAAEAALLAKGLEFGSHRGVIAGFGEEFVKKGRISSEFGRGLSRMYKERQYVEYDVTAKVGADRTRELVALATEFVAEVRRHL